MMDEQAVQSVRIAVGLLVDGQYKALENMTQRRRLTASEMEYAIRSYGRTLVNPPEDAFEDMDAIRVENSSDVVFSVDFPLWTEEEGRSDLEVKMSLREVMDGIFSVEVDDILVP